MLQVLGRGALVALAFATLCPAYAQEFVAVKVRLPDGLHASSIETRAAADGKKYVTITTLFIHNPSHHQPQAYEPKQFKLVAGTHIFTPVVRPKLDAIDLGEPGLLAPGASTHVNLAFLVPDSVKVADLQFTPHWQSDDSGIVDFVYHQ